jgi:hypothetical protein
MRLLVLEVEEAAAWAYALEMNTGDPSALDQGNQ